MVEFNTLFVGGIPGGPEMLVVLLLAVLLFGANKIPKLARSSGQAIGEFQKGREQVEQELEEMKEGVDVEGTGEEGSEFESTGTSTSTETSTGTSTGTETSTSTGGTGGAE